MLELVILRDTRYRSAGILCPGNAHNLFCEAAGLAALTVGASALIFRPGEGLREIRRISWVGAACIFGLAIRKSFRGFLEVHCAPNPE
jgi:hypothetical protein